MIALWNSLPRCVRNMSGENVDIFKRLDKILGIYPDKTRFAMSGNTFGRHGCRSNSLYDTYRNRDVKKKLDKITKI